MRANFEHRGARATVVGGLLLVLTLALTAGACGGGRDCDSAPPPAEGGLPDTAPDDFGDGVRTVAAPERTSGGSSGGSGGRSRGGTTSGGSYGGSDCD